MPLTSIKDANIQHPVKAQTWSSSSFYSSTFSQYDNSTSKLPSIHLSVPTATFLSVCPSSPTIQTVLNIFFNCYTTAWGKFRKQKATRWLLCTNPPQCLSVSLGGKFNSLKESTRLLCLACSLTTWPYPHSNRIQPHLTLQGLEYSIFIQEETTTSRHLCSLSISNSSLDAQENLPSLPRLGYLSYLFSVLSLPLYNTFMTFPLSNIFEDGKNHTSLVDLAKWLTEQI